MLETFIDVLALSDLPPGTQKTVSVGFTRILLCRNNERFYAVEDVCAHALQPLNGGKVQDGTIQCPKHGACFDLASGRPTNGVTNRSIRTFQIRVQNDRIEIESSAIGSQTVPAGFWPPKPATR